MPLQSSEYSHIYFSYELIGTYSSVSLIGNELIISLPTEDETISFCIHVTDGVYASAKTIVFTVKAKEVWTISEARALEDNINVKIKGTVVAITSRGYVLWDSTDAVYVYAYSGDQQYYELGDFVLVEGKTTTYNGEEIIPNSSRKLDEGTQFVGAPTVLTGSMIDEYIFGS